MIELIVVIIVLLTVISLFFKLNCLSLRSFSRVKLQDAFDCADSDKLVDNFADSAEEFLLTCSIFRAIVNLGLLAAIAAVFMIEQYTLFMVICVVEIIILAIPHSWAKYTGEKILVRTYKLLGVLTGLLRPLLKVLALHDTLVRRLAAVPQTDPEQAQDKKQEEILSVVEEGKMEGVVDEDEMEMIENVFELGDTTAEEIMTPRTDIVAVNIKDDLQAILDTITQAGHSRIPVYEENIDKIIGLVYAKDLLSEINKDIADFSLSTKMRKPYFVPETKPLDDLLHEFQNQKLHIAIVLDEYGGTAGVVTIEDILEELVGEITDEYETDGPAAIQKIDENTIDADARGRIDDLNSDYDLKLPEDEDYDTLGGFVFSHLGYIPKTGEEFNYENIKFTITAAESRKIKRVKVRKLPTQQEQD